MFVLPSSTTTTKKEYDFMCISTHQDTVVLFIRKWVIYNQIWLHYSDILTQVYIKSNSGKYMGVAHIFLIPYYENMNY